MKDHLRMRLHLNLLKDKYKYIRNLVGAKVISPTHDSVGRKIPKNLIWDVLKDSPSAYEIMDKSPLRVGGWENKKGSCCCLCCCGFFGVFLLLSEIMRFSKKVQSQQQASGIRNNKHGNRTPFTRGLDSMSTIVVK
jgi:hypothetical protein